MAIQKINEIIKTEHQSSLNRPSRFTNAPPPLMSLHSGVTSVVCNIFISRMLTINVQVPENSDLGSVEVGRVMIGSD